MMMTAAMAAHRSPSTTPQLLANRQVEQQIQPVAARQQQQQQQQPPNTQPQAVGTRQTATSLTGQMVHNPLAPVWTPVLKAGSRVGPVPPSSTGISRAGASVAECTAPHPVAAAVAAAASPNQPQSPRKPLPETPLTHCAMRLETLEQQSTLSEHDTVTGDVQEDASSERHGASLIPAAPDTAPDASSLQLHQLNQQLHERGSNSPSQTQLHELEEQCPAPTSRGATEARASCSQPPVGCSSRAWWEVMAQARAHRCEQRPGRDSVCSEAVA